MNQLSTDLQTLQETEKHSDVTFLFEELELKAHKALLSARSPVFAGMFEHETTLEVQKGKVKIEDVSKEAFEQFIKYLYSGSIAEIELVTDELLVLADKVLLFVKLNKPYHTII